MATGIIRNVLPTTERKYHDTDSAYVLPNDNTEHDRLDAQAAAITKMIGGMPFKAPLEHRENLFRMVDVGCGTGIATLQLASLFPQAKVYGVDISPVPERCRELALSNIEWALGNILDVGHAKVNDSVMDKDIFRPESLDYIFGRMLFLGVNDWARYFSILAASMSPGGLIEHQDLDWKFYRAQTGECVSDNWEWHKYVMQANDNAGLSNYAGSNAEAHLKQAGLEIVRVQRYEFSFVPTSKTPDSQQMGRYVQEKLMPNYPELLRKMLGSLSISSEKLEQLTQQCLQDLTSEEGIHQKYTVTIAKKV